MLSADARRPGSPRPPLDADPATAGKPAYRSERTVVRRCRAADGRKLVVKQALGPSASARIAAEATILRRLGGVSGVPALHGPDGVDGPDGPDGATSLLLQDCGDRTLSDLIGFGPRDPRQVLALMMELAEIMTAVHRAGVVHRDINPNNVVVDGDAAPHLVDFDLATADGQTRPGFAEGGTVLGHLPYLAPEQTGRTGWPVDQRSDLYGLGATAYALAVGEPPFGDGDPVTLVRDILVRQPTPLTDRVPGMSQALSAVVSRLLQKEPDRRYQSARGLLLDLRRLAADPGADFTIGRWDFPARLQPPARLVGRDPDLRRLERALEEAVQGRSSAVLVAGEPGVGKSVLIEQLRPQVTARGGWFVAGKADQFAHDPGSNVFARAAGAVGNLLLGLPTLQLDPIRDRLRRDLGDNAGLMTAILPVFEHLLGIPPQVAEGDPLENERRLVGCAPGLFRAIAGRDRPVVIMLDDLQWADPSALTVIDTMLTEQVPGVLLVGGYRSTEVDAAHPLTAMIRRWERLGVAPRHLDLAPLPSTDLAGLLEGVLRLDQAAAARLAEQIARRSHGNPYETLELVNALYAEGVLRLGDDGWEWDDAQLRDVVGSRDVVQVLQARFRRLPEPAREALQLMACLGREVDRDLLAVACDVDEDGLMGRLGHPEHDHLRTWAGSWTDAFDRATTDAHPRRTTAAQPRSGRSGRTPRLVSPRPARLHRRRPPPRWPPCTTCSARPAPHGRARPARPRSPHSHQGRRRRPADHPQTPQRPETGQLPGPAHRRHLRPPGSRRFGYHRTPRRDRPALARPAGRQRPTRHCRRHRARTALHRGHPAGTRSRRTRVDRTVRHLARRTVGHHPVPPGHRTGPLLAPAPPLTALTVPVRPRSGSP